MHHCISRVFTTKSFHNDLPYSPHNCPKHRQVHFLQIAYSVLFNLQGAIQCQTLQYMQFNNNATYWKNCISEQYARPNNAIHCLHCTSVMYARLFVGIHCSITLNAIHCKHAFQSPFPGQVKLTMHSMKSLTCVGADVWIQLMEWPITAFAPFLLRFYPGHSLGLVLVWIRSTVETIMVIIAH